MHKVLKVCEVANNWKGIYRHSASEEDKHGRSSTFSDYVSDDSMSTRHINPDLESQNTHHSIEFPRELEGLNNATSQRLNAILSIPKSYPIKT